MSCLACTQGKCDEGHSPNVPLNKAFCPTCQLIWHKLSEITPLPTLSSDDTEGPWFLNGHCKNGKEGLKRHRRNHLTHNFIKSERCFSTNALGSTPLLWGESSLLYVDVAYLGNGTSQSLGDLSLILSIISTKPLYLSIFINHLSVTLRFSEEFHIHFYLTFKYYK